MRAAGSRPGHDIESIASSLRAPSSVRTTAALSELMERYRPAPEGDAVPKQIGPSQDLPHLS